MPISAYTTEKPNNFRSSMGFNIFKAKYAFNPDETWLQRCRTIVEYVCGSAGGTKHPLMSAEDRHDLTHFMHMFMFIPGGRYIYYAGRPAPFFNNCFGAETKVRTREGWVAVGDAVGGIHDVLSPVDGKYYPAEFYQHGEQLLNTITFKAIRGGSTKTWTVRATAGHHWALQGGRDTHDLSVGDVVPANEFSAEEDPLGFVHGFMFGDGTLVKGCSAGSVRLCGAKNKHAVTLARAGATFTQPPFAKGDSIAYLPATIDVRWKELPGIDTHSVSYITSFVRGWLAADGHENKSAIGSYVMSSVTRSNLEWLEENAALAGFVVTGNIRSQIRDVVIGSYKYEGHEIFSLTIREGSSFNGFKVVSIEPDGVEPVYCPFEPVHNQIVIDHNIHTYQCFLFKGLEDTREEWGRLLRSASDSLMSGGGIGVNYDVFRPRVSLLRRTGGVASGPIPLALSIDAHGANVKQGGGRRSAIYGSLNWRHGDINEWLGVKDWENVISPGTNMSYAEIRRNDFDAYAPLQFTNISTNYDDDFLTEICAGVDLNEPYLDEDELEEVAHDKPTWDTITAASKLPATFMKNTRLAMRNGEPGFSFNFFDKVKEVLRNACQPFETPILTDEGYVQIGERVGLKTRVWNGVEWSETIPFPTGMKQLYDVVTSDGITLHCSPNHEFVLNDGTRVKAENLEGGEKLGCWKAPILEFQTGYIPVIDGYSQGFYAADGNTGLPYSWVYEPKYCCKDRLEGVFMRAYGKRITWKHGPMLDKSYVPHNTPMEYRLDWLAGLLDGDGTVIHNKNSICVQLGSIDSEFLHQVQLMLQTMGCNVKVTFMRAAGYAYLPDGKGGLKSYRQQTVYRLHISAGDINTLLDLGLRTERLDLSGNNPQRSAQRSVFIVSAEPTAKVVDTYCLTEEKRHMAVFDGVLTGQCTEVVSEDDSDQCNIGSVNMAAVPNLDTFERVVELGSKFLVCGTLRGLLPDEKTLRVREKNRRIGLGLMGMHEWMLQRSQKYGFGPELHKWMSVYRDESTRAANEHCDRFFINRPIAYRAIAPTGSIGTMAGTTTGCEPIYAAALKRRYLEGNKQTGHEVRKFQYVIDRGAKQMIDLYDVDPDSIETAMELAKTPERRIEFQADLQDYVDQGISSTLNLPAWDTEHNNEDRVEEFARTVARFAPRLRGLTMYPDGARGGQPLVAVPYAEAMEHGEDTVFEENSDKACKSGVCGI